MNVGNRDLVFYIRVVEWFRSCHAPITADDISRRFDVSRATSFRWLRAWKDATGQV